MMIVEHDKEKDAVTIHCMAREARVIAICLAEYATTCLREANNPDNLDPGCRITLTRSIVTQTAKLSEIIQDAVEW